MFERKKSKQFTVSLKAWCKVETAKQQILIKKLPIFVLLNLVKAINSLLFSFVLKTNNSKMQQYLYMKDSVYNIYYLYKIF